MIPRTLEDKLKEVAKKYPVVLLTGPRQSGKTTLCRRVFPKKDYVSFENPDVREFAQSDPKGLLEKYPQGAVFDEIQRVPELLSYIQGIVDERNKEGMYILTGSQNILLLKSVQQSLAGRVAILKLLPFSYHEIASLVEGFSLDKILYTGGFPRIFDKKLNPTETMRNYVESYVERDVRQIINVKNLSSFQRFLKLCAGRIGQILSLSSIGNDAGVSHTTVREWLSVLQASYIVYLLPAYYRNFNKRIVKSPKLFFYDVGLAAYLLGIDGPQYVSRDSLRGNLFENFVLIEMLKHFWAQARQAPLYYFRDNVGNEVDLLLAQGDRVVGVEFKAGQTINSEWFKSLEYLKKVMGDNVIARAVVYGGQESQKRTAFSIYSYKETMSLYRDFSKEA
jgi:uncharacterized protein